MLYFWAVNPMTIYFIFFCISYIQQKCIFLSIQRQCTIVGIQFLFACAIGKKHPFLAHVLCQTWLGKKKLAVIVKHMIWFFETEVIFLSLMGKYTKNPKNGKWQKNKKPIIKLIFWNR